MIGRTNVGGGGSKFAAYLEVSTDAYAVITAVNLAGDTYSGTADSSGDLTLTIRNPGTYTVTETNGGTGTIVIADNEETYQISVIAFDGDAVINGEAVTPMTALAIDYSNSFGSWTGIVPTISTSGSGQDCVINVTVSSSSNSGVYVTSYVDISDYTAMRFRYKTQKSGNGNDRVIAIDEQNQLIEISGATSSSLYVETIQFPNTMDRTKKYRLGVLVYGGCTFSINSFTLQ